MEIRCNVFKFSSKADQAQPKVVDDGKNKVQPQEAEPKIDTTQTNETPVATDEPDVEPGDEIEFMRPLLIDDFNEKRNQKTRDGDLGQHSGKPGEAGSANTWENGPAAYWYNFYDLENLILEEKKKLEARKNKSLKVKTLIFESKK